MLTSLTLSLLNLHNMKSQIDFCLPSKSAGYANFDRNHDMPSSPIDTFLTFARMQRQKVSFKWWKTVNKMDAYILHSKFLSQFKLKDVKKRRFSFAWRENISYLVGFALIRSWFASVAAFESVSPTGHLLVQTSFLRLFKRHKANRITQILFVGNREQLNYWKQLGTQTVSE